MILSTYSYAYDIAKQIVQTIKAPNVQAKQVNIIDWELIGSRLSAKTIQTLKWLIELGYQNEVKISTDIWRYEVSGAKETYEELIATIEDIYDIETNIKNSNSTNRTLTLPNNTIKVNGYLSNRKNKTPKLGKARKGIKKDVQINVFEEATEFLTEKQIQVIQQATGGAKTVINIYIANPWVLSNWYVAKVNKFLPFNEKQLRKDGEQFKTKYFPKEKRLRIAHITNHRINTYLSEAQHQMLYDAWKISDQFARVVDLGMPGVAEGLIYAPIVHLIGQTVRVMPTQEYRGGIDWGTSSASGGSATTMILGRIGRDYAQLALDEEYYHSNATMHYKDDNTLIQELAQQMLWYVKANKEKIQASDTGHLTVYYDYAAAGLGKMLKDELSKYKQEKLIADLILIKACAKFEVPTRIDIVKMLISQGRYKINKDKMPNHLKELENSQWEETKLVNGRPTRLNEDDHTLDAMEYLIGKSLLKFADNNYLSINKVLSTNYSQGAER